MSLDNRQLNFHVSQEDKEMLKRAARLSGKTLGAFVRDAAVTEAERQRDERIQAFQDGRFE